MAIGDDLTINYIDQTIKFTGGSTVYSANALYSYLAGVFDEPGQMDDPVPMTAQTPTDYTLVNGWFIDDPSFERIDGGAIKTSGWLDEIRRFVMDPSSYVNCVAGDVGKTVQGASTGDTGTLLAFDNTTRTWWVRMDAAGDLFDDRDELINVVSGTGQGDLVNPSQTGESIWANPFSLGTIVDETEVYVVQDASKLSQWWATGHIDILVKVSEVGTLVDDGVITVFARQFSKLYDHFGIDLSAGGRQPVPLSAGNDLDNQNGYRTVNFDNRAGNDLEVGDVLQVSATNRAIALAVTGGDVATGSFEYYLIGDLTDFSNDEAVTVKGDDTTLDIDGAASNVGPSTYSDVTFAFTAITRNINNGAGLRPYSIEIDCGGRVLSQVYERLKFLTRRGSTTQLDNQDGEQYIGNELQLEYDGQLKNFTEGDIATGQTSGALGTIVADHDDGATGDLILRNVRGTFVDGEPVRDQQASSGIAYVNSTTGGRTITPEKKSPFGTFAGGKFFGAPGVYITNFDSDDAQNYQLIDDDGTVQVPPNVVGVSVTSLEIGDVVGVFVLQGAGLPIDKAQHTLAAGNNQGDADLVVQSAIPAATPPSGVVRVVDITDTTNIRERRYRYSSFTSATFTLTAVPTGDKTADAGGSSTVLIDASATFIADGVLKGDVIRNVTDGANPVLVVSVDSEIQLTTEALTGGGSDDWATGDTYEVNKLDRNYVSGDAAYVPIIDEVATGTSVSNTLTYSADIETTVRVRKGGDILPFETPGTVKSTGLTVAAIRNPDDIAS